MIGALGSCPCEGDLGDFFGRCGGLTMRSTHGSVVSSLYAPTRSAVGFGLERLPGRRLFPGGNVVGFTPRGRKRLQGPISVDQLGPPPPSTVFVGVPAQWMEFGSKREKKARRWKRSAGLGHDANV